MENKTEYLGNAKSIFDGNKIEVNFKVEELLNAIEKYGYEYDGKKYFKLDVLKRKSADEYGNSHYTQANTYYHNKFNSNENSN